MRNQRPELFEVVEDGAVRFEIDQSYRLAETEGAHRALEGRRTTGWNALLP